METVTAYFMRNPLDNPHRLSPTVAGQARCGLGLNGARAVTELQVLVYLHGRKCDRCDPSAAHRSAGGRKSAATRRQKRGKA